MTNRNKKIVKNAKEEVRKKAIKKYHQNNRLDLILLIGALSYPIIFFVISFINGSVLLSLLLSIFSLLTTFVFEFLEWTEFKLKFRPKSKFIYFSQRIFKNKSIVLLMIPVMFVVVMASLYIIHKINPKAYIKEINNIDVHIPNIITTVTFVGYFISFYIRNYSEKKEKFIASFIRNKG